MYTPISGPTILSGPVYGYNQIKCWILQANPHTQAVCPRAPLVNLLTWLFRFEATHLPTVVVRYKEAEATATNALSRDSRRTVFGHISSIQWPPHRQRSGCWHVSTKCHLIKGTTCVWVRRDAIGNPAAWNYSKRMKLTKICQLNLNND